MKQAFGYKQDEEITGLLNSMWHFNMWHNPPMESALGVNEEGRKNVGYELDVRNVTIGLIKLKTI